MKYTLFLSLIIISFFIGKFSEKELLRFPATINSEPQFQVDKKNESSSPNIAESIEKACKQNTQLSYCIMLNQTKDKMEKIGEEYSKHIQSYIGDEASIVSLFLLKSIIENKIQIETRSHYGNAELVVKDQESIFYWKIKKDF